MLNCIHQRLQCWSVFIKRWSGVMCCEICRGRASELQSADLRDSSHRWRFHGSLEVLAVLECCANRDRGSFTLCPHEHRHRHGGTAQPHRLSPVTVAFHFLCRRRHQRLPWQASAARHDTQGQQELYLHNISALLYISPFLIHHWFTLRLLASYRVIQQSIGLISLINFLSPFKQ